mgnify:CR=1 FL=1
MSILETIVKASVRSWRTTVAGSIAGLTMLLPQIEILTDGDATTTADWNVIMLGLAIVLGFASARDNNKTSRAAGAGAAR